MQEEEFEAISGMLKQLQFELPQPSEYKNELALPAFLLPASGGVSGGVCPKSSSRALATIPEEVTATSPPSTAHWGKLDTMVDFVCVCSVVR